MLAMECQSTSIQLTHHRQQAGSYRIYVNRTFPEHSYNGFSVRRASTTPSATTISPNATAKVTRMPWATASGGVWVMSAACEARANTAPNAEAPVINPKFRDRLSMPETTPR